ncbi:hypothetical protein ABZ690_17200 [Streptomyces sp. NPDC006967]|uniref:hypothetical protein n=1 Tax=Streptomyces sp. NPDC006967 TaxID=3156906 RepID=UPI0033F60A21
MSLKPVTGGVHRTEVVATGTRFVERWRRAPNFPISSALFRPEFRFPDALEVLDFLRKDDRTRVTLLGEESQAIRTARTLAFRNAPLEEVAAWPFRLVHFDLHRFYGSFLQGFQEQVMIPWRVLLSSLGFTWQRCYPILFMSSQGCSSTYHVDNSHGLVWQVEGTKRFHSFHEAQRFAPVEAAVQGRITSERPPPYEPEDLHHMLMAPGDLLWNHILTPHWVTAESPLTVSVNISHGGLTHQGRLAEREVALRRHWDEHPAEPWTSGLRHVRY